MSIEEKFKNIGIESDTKISSIASTWMRWIVVMNFWEWDDAVGLILYLGIKGSLG